MIKRLETREENIEWVMAVARRLIAEGWTQGEIRRHSEIGDRTLFSLPGAIIAACKDEFIREGALCSVEVLEKVAYRVPFLMGRKGNGSVFGDRVRNAEGYEERFEALVKLLQVHNDAELTTKLDMFRALQPFDYKVFEEGVEETFHMMEARRRGEAAGTWRGFRAYQRSADCPAEFREDADGAGK